MVGQENGAFCQVLNIATGKLELGKKLVVDDFLFRTKRTNIF